MDQQREDYAEPGVRRPHPWTPREIAILLVAVGIALPVLAILTLFGLWAAFPDQ
jgi:hypothetical protein